MSVKAIKLSDGVEGLFIKNTRFNTTLISFNFYLPLAADSVAANALLPFILTTCSAKYPDFTKLNYKLNKLYGATLSASSEKLSDCQLLKMSVSVVDDKFTLENESLVKQACELLLRLIFAPHTENGQFFEADLAREKRKAIEHIQGEISEKRIYAKNRLISEMYKGKPFGLQKCGTAEEVNAVDTKRLYEAWENMLTSAFVRIHVVGAAVPSGLFDDISAKFSEVTRTNITDYTVCEPTKAINPPKEVTERLDIAQGKLVMGFSSDMHGDDAESLPLLIMCDIFGGGPYSRLFENVREKLSLCYYCSASALRRKGLLTVESGVEAENEQKARKEILKQLDIMKNNAFTDFAFESSLKSICNSLNSYNDSQTSLELWYALRNSNELPPSPEELALKVRDITREDVVGAANGIKLHTVYRLLPKENSVKEKTPL